MNVFAFGSFDAPIYRARFERRRWDLDCQHYCCKEGHTTPRGAALHAADIATAQWEARVEA